jgi:hypothetical protein
LKIVSNMIEYLNNQKLRLDITDTWSEIKDPEEA